MRLDSNIVLVTGPNGFIGRNLCRRLHYLGATVVGLVRNGKVVNEFLESRHIVDITDSKGVDKAVVEINPDIVIHLAGKKYNNTDNGYIDSYQTNLIGSCNLIQSCQKLKSLKSFIYIGSCEEYGRLSVPFREVDREVPVSSYGCSKLAVTQLLQSLSSSVGFPSLIIRPSVVYGPGQSASMFVPSLINALLQEKEFDMTFGDQTRDFVFIDDLIEFIVLLCNENIISPNILNASSGKGVYIKDVAKLIANLITPSSVKLINFGVKGYSESEVMNYCASNTLACKKLKWEPKVNLKNGLIKTLEYYSNKQYQE
jgi:nucleoside-diphosphate-sugar epimerase